MGVVAPGNKQIGTYNITLLKRSDKTVKLGAVSSTALVRNSDTAIPIAPYNVNIGVCNFNLIGRAPTPILRVGAALASALVKYTPPPDVSIRSASGFAVVKNNSITAIPTPVLSLGIGGFSFAGLTACKNTAKVSAVIGVALVQRFEQRNENVYHPTNYGINNTVV